MANSSRVCTISFSVGPFLFALVLLPADAEGPAVDAAVMPADPPLVPVAAVVESSAASALKT